ncbi:hypothetical protein J3D55_001384 [Chryseobacterium ginsenosidimutans]|uniref:hypothetical protein n=1 Tax=Chryseobacterium ginsenosidimutans TaxID=687846 RepID=UPI0021698AB4|nr:hypothetical protein [Chryseobacterium ginsenosidimutans]MCS3868468.1 hypothetical protein [Chryseobacterium ginsenosidimutans]
MMKLKLVLLSLLFTSTLFFGQTAISKAHNYIYAAEVMLKEKKYNEALTYFEKSFKLAYTDNPNYLLDAACSAFKLKKDKIAYTFLEQSITDYKIPLEFLKTYGKLKEFQNNELFKKVINNYDILYRKFYNNKKDLDIFLEVEELKHYDQYTRKIDAYYSGYNLDDFNQLDESRHPKEISNKDYLKFRDQLTNKTDSLNAVRLIEITKKRGYQKNSWLLLWHHRTTYTTNDYFWSYFKPFIQDQIKVGNVEKSFFAQFEDAVESMHSEKQKYGTAWDNSITIEDIKNVDNLREEINLPPLYYNYYIYGTPLPENYKMSYEEFKKKIMNAISEK